MLHQHHLSVSVTQGLEHLYTSAHSMAKIHHRAHPQQGGLRRTHGNKNSASIDIMMSSSLEYDNLYISLPGVTQFTSPLMMVSIKDSIYTGWDTFLFTLSPFCIHSHISFLKKETLKSVKRLKTASPADTNRQQHFYRTLQIKALWHKRALPRGQVVKKNHTGCHHLFSNESWLHYQKPGIWVWPC